MLEQRIAGGELDLVVIAGPSSQGQLASELVGKVQFVWAAAPGLKQRFGKTPAELMRTQCLVTLPDAAGGTLCARPLAHAERPTAPIGGSCATAGAPSPA